MRVDFIIFHWCSHAGGEARIWPFLLSIQMWKVASSNCVFLRMKYEGSFNLRNLISIGRNCQRICFEVFFWTWTDMLSRWFNVVLGFVTRILRCFTEEWIFSKRKSKLILEVNHSTSFNQLRLFKRCDIPGTILRKTSKLMPLVCILKLRVPEMLLLESSVIF